MIKSINEFKVFLNEIHKIKENMNTTNTVYSIGDKYELFYNTNNPNNKKFEIRAIIDNEVIVYLSDKGNYKMESIDWFDFNIENGNLKKV